MRVPGPTGCAGVGLCALEREVGVDERSSSRYLEVYRLDAVLEKTSDGFDGIAWKEVGRSGVDRPGAPVDDEVSAADLLAGLPAMVSFVRRTSKASPSSPRSSSTIALAADRSFDADAAIDPDLLLDAAAEEDGVPLAPFARDRKTTLGPATSSSPWSSNSSTARRDPFELDVAPLFIACIGPTEMLDGPAVTSSSSS